MIYFECFFSSIVRHCFTGSDHDVFKLNVFLLSYCCHSVAKSQGKFMSSVLMCSCSLLTDTKISLAVQYHNELPPVLFMLFSCVCMCISLLSSSCSVVPCIFSVVITVAAASPMHVD